MYGKTVVYLAGGMRGDWQDRVIRACEGLDFKFIDPRKNRTKERKEYTVLDLHGVKVSQIVFAYFEDSNPSCAGACCECGYARGLGKTIILINESNDKYLKFVESLADIVFDNFESGVEFLKKFQ